MMDFLIILATHDTPDPLTIVTISQKIKVHRNYVTRLLMPLKEAGYLSINYGGSGGCKFKILPENISILQLVELIDGPASIRALFEPCSPGSSTHASNLPQLWSTVDRDIRKILDTVTVQDVIDAHLKDTEMQNQKPLGTP